MAKRFAALALALVGLFWMSGVAQAAVVVPPGANGHTCSANQHVIYDGWITTPVYWQTCAWADNNEVYFTVNLGNGYETSTWYVDTIQLEFVRAGKVYKCVVYGDFPVPPKSVKSTPTADCARGRAAGAYAARAYVSDYNYTGGASSPTLQVQ